jgi:CRP-like cAMP-binding protein
VPRSATCVAKTNVELYTIDRDRFVSAITGNSTSAREIENVIHSRLTESTVAA